MRCTVWLGRCSSLSLRHRKRHLQIENCGRLLETHLHAFAVVLEKKKKKDRTETHNDRFTSETKRRKINCLTKELTLCDSCPRVYVWMDLVSKTCDDFCSPKHYFQLSLFFCQSFQLDTGWPTNCHSCLRSGAIIAAPHCIPPLLRTHSFSLLLSKCQTIMALLSFFFMRIYQNNPFIQIQLEIWTDEQEQNNGVSSHFTGDFGCLAGHEQEKLDF